MKFCPQCHNLMVPVRKGGKYILKCRVCGYEEEIPRQVGYVLKHQVEAEKHVKTAKVSEEKAKLFRKEEEREMLQEYYEIFLETFSEEEGSGTE